MNPSTHKALLINRDGTDASIIVEGTRHFCVVYAEIWAAKHPLGAGMVLSVVKVEEVIAEGMVS